jgi:transcriptional regulator with XRE-family HTH domain
MPPSPHFSENVTRLIGMHGLTAKEAALVLGVSPQTISSWLRGHSGPSTSIALAVSQFFEVPADRLFTGSFADLLDVLGNKERYERVDAKIRRARIKGVD